MKKAAAHRRVLRTHLRCAAVCAAAALLLLSCATPDHVRSFYVGDGALQYFVRPSRFAGGDGTAIADFTVRILRDSEEPATCNFTLVRDDDAPASPVTAAGFLLDGTIRTELVELALLFSDSGGREVRYTSRLAYDSFVSLLRASRVDLVIDTPGSSLIFEATGEFYERQKAARAGILGE